MTDYSHFDETEIKESILQGLDKAIECNKTDDFSKILKSILSDFEAQIQKSKASMQCILEAIIRAYPAQQAAVAAIYRTLPNQHIKTWAEYESSIISFDESKDFKSAIFKRRFPMGTISYIGARPARGKTTLLVNIALDAIAQGKPAVYVTAEETAKQIITRLILCESYKTNVKDADVMSQTRSKMLFESNTRTAFYTYIKNKSQLLDGIAATNADRYEFATLKIKDLIQRGRLTIFESYKATFNELKAFLTMQEAGSLIVIDYIQHLRAPEVLVTQTRQIQVQEISHTLADIAGQCGLIIISGAQFNRPATSHKDITQQKADTFDESSFREAGDIEQDGHILIGLGKDKKTDTFYFSCMKDREAAPDNGKLWRIEKNLAYSYMTAAIDNGNHIAYELDANQKQIKKATKSDCIDEDMVF